MDNIRALRHLFATAFLWGFAATMVAPAIIDFTMQALCPGQDECSLAIYLSGFQQAIIGLGTLVMMPVIGNLSDEYGRKAMLTLPLTLSIVPLAVLELYSRMRKTGFFYAYYVLKTLTSMVCEGGIICLAHAYVADNISERQRASAFGILSGVMSASFVFGTLAARFFSTNSTIQVATFVSMLAVVYMRVFLKESVPLDHGLKQPILRKGTDDVNNNNNNNNNKQNEGNPTRKIPVSKTKIPSVRDIACLLKSSVTLSQAAVVAFFTSVSEGGTQASLLYFLKARFHFNKNQFADLMLISGIAGAVSQLLLMPFLAPILGEGKLLSLGLLAASVSMFLGSIAWSAWVVYATTLFAVLIVFAPPSLRSIISKQVGSNEQGKAQGCISGISSFGNILSPLIFSPLTALFLSDAAPFNFPGFSIMVVGIVSMIAFIQSIMMRDIPSTSMSQNHCCLEA